MKAIPKTEACIRMLREAKIIFSPIYYTKKGYFNKVMLIDFQNRIKAMLNYRLLPPVVISVADHIDKETARSEMQHIADFDLFWYVMKNYPLVTSNDLKNEFWELCPDLNKILEFLDVMNVKFDDVNYNYETAIDKIKMQYSGLSQCVEEGILSEQEADEMYWNIHFIADRYNSIIESIRSVYRNFRRLVKPEALQQEHNGNQIRTLLECFGREDHYNEALNILRSTIPCVIDTNNNYKAGSRSKVALSEWINFLSSNPNFDFRKPEKRKLVTLLNITFHGLNMGKDGRTLDNTNRKWNSEINNRSK